jgi:hypothetical protein
MIAQLRLNHHFKKRITAAIASGKRRCSIGIAQLTEPRKETLVPCPGLEMISTVKPWA